MVDVDPGLYFGRAVPNALVVGLLAVGGCLFTELVNRLLFATVKINGDLFCHSYLINNYGLRIKN